MENSFEGDFSRDIITNTPISGRRGRPPSDTIKDLVDQGVNSNNRIKCPHCRRVFPREKSLNAHIRTHTSKSDY